LGNLKSTRSTGFNSSITKLFHNYSIHLLAIQLHNQLLIHRQLNIFPLGQRGYATFEVIAIDFNPVRRIRVPSEFFRLLQNRQLLAGLANGDLFPDRDLVRRNVYLPAIDADVSMTNKLPRLSSRNSQSHAQDDAIEPALKLLQEQLAGHALGARSLLEVIAELAFLGKINALGFLLL